MIKRRDKRELDELRPLKIEKDYLKDAEGSCLIEMGATKVICAATIEERTPYFLRDTNSGWIQATYSMLPRSCKERIQRERTSGRIYEIQRLIGRTFRSVANLQSIKGFTITIDCDVVQADGGTRTASITGGWLALYDAVQYMLEHRMIEYSPLNETVVAAVSVGILANTPILDLSYYEDANAEIDMNIIMTENGKLIEVQGTGEKRPFTKSELNAMLVIAEKGISKIIEVQRKTLFLNNIL